MEPNNVAFDNLVKKIQEALKEYGETTKLNLNHVLLDLDKGTLRGDIYDINVTECKLKGHGYLLFQESGDIEDLLKF